MRTTTRITLLAIAGGILLLFCVPQVRLYRLAMRLTEAEIQRNHRELTLVERAKDQEDEMRAGLEKAETRLLQLQFMFPPELNSSAFETLVVEWLDQNRAAPLSCKRTETENEIYLETALEIEVSRSPSEIEALFFNPLPWSRLVVWSTEQSSEGGTRLTLRAFAVPDLPFEALDVPCAVPSVRVWLWPLSTKLADRQQELADLCTRIESENETLIEVHHLTQQKQRIEYLEEVSSLLLVQ